MIEVSLNNEKRTVKSQTLTEFLNECDFNADKIAVAVNTEFVPRSEYGNFIIKAQDEIDVLSAVQGG